MFGITPVTKEGWPLLAFFLWLILFVFLDLHGHPHAADLLGTITVVVLGVAVFIGLLWSIFSK